MEELVDGNVSCRSAIILPMTGTGQSAHHHPIDQHPRPHNR